MGDFLELAITGASFGAAYALLALSINVIYSSSNVLNFAQGEFMMVGGILGWALYSEAGLPYVVVLTLVVAILAVLGLAEYALVVRPLLRRRAPIISIIIGTLGVSIVVKMATALAAGGVERFAKPPLGRDALRFFGATVLPQTLLLIVVAAAALSGLWWLYTRTVIGAALRAAAYQADGAQLAGVNVVAVVGGTFAVGAALAGVAGLLISPLSFASPWLGLDFAVLGFAAAVIGGLGSWPGAVVGGLILGISQALVLRYVSAEWGTMLTFILLLAVLYLRPSGIFGERQALQGSM